MKAFSTLSLNSTLLKSAHKLVAGFLVTLSLLIVTPSAMAENSNLDFSQAELDQMLAPIALYPDTILSQVLIASTYPIEVIQADRWARANTSAKGADAVKLVDNKNWDPSVKALVAFPDILQRMSDDVDWTQKLGDAFLSNEEGVMDTVQSLRKKAYNSGSLKQVEHLRVERNDDEIVIEPAEERVVYVPVYDTRVIYGDWWWPEYPPVYWHYPSSYVYVSGFYWGPRIFIGPTFFYSSCQWHDRHVVVVDYRSHNYGQTHFYTGRSIVAFSGAREWHHDPIHRRGVAYYNDNLRDTYGSHHNSYNNDREYREHLRYHPQDDRHPQNHFDNDYLNKHPELNRHSNNGINFNNGGDSRPRNEQVRERLEDQQRSNNHDEHSDNHERENHNVDNRSRNEQVRDRLNAEDQTDNREREERNNRARSQQQSQPQPQPQTTDGFRPAWQSDPRNRTEDRNREQNNNVQSGSMSRPNIERDNQRNTQRTETNNPQPVHIDDSMTRRVEARSQETQRNEKRQKKDDDDKK